MIQTKENTTENSRFIKAMMLSTKYVELSPYSLGRMVGLEGRKAWALFNTLAAKGILKNIRRSTYVGRVTVGTFDMSVVAEYQDEISREKERLKNNFNFDEVDEHFKKAVKLVENGEIKSSKDLQKKLDIGCVRSARIFEQLEEAGILDLK